MMYRFIGKLLLLLVCFSFVPVQKKSIRLFLVGDSTMCTYEPSRAPLTGWGMPFAHFFDTTVQVENRARGGRSTRTFISEGRWKAVADSLQPDDYVLIQFGHNDEAKEERYRDRYTPVQDYKANLHRFVAEARARGARPVLVTPVSRRKFNAAGKAEETHQEYTAAMHRVAGESHTPLIDLDLKSRELLQAYGPEGSKLLFLHLDSGAHPNYPKGQKDNTHFNEYGARLMAQLVLQELRLAAPELAERVRGK